VHGEGPTRIGEAADTSDSVCRSRFLVSEAAALAGLTARKHQLGGGGGASVGEGDEGTGMASLRVSVSPHSSPPH
jgi:L-aminopeptidase/D-esterase-like protein